MDPLTDALGVHGSQFKNLWTKHKLSRCFNNREGSVESFLGFLQARRGRVSLYSVRTSQEKWVPDRNLAGLPRSIIYLGVNRNIAACLVQGFSNYFVLPPHFKMFFSMRPLER